MEVLFSAMEQGPKAADGTVKLKHFAYVPHFFPFFIFLL